MTGTAFDDHDATYVSEHHAFQAALLKSMVNPPNPRALTSTAASAIIGKPSTAPTKVENTVVLHNEKKDAYSPHPRTSPQVRESQQQYQNVTPYYHQNQKHVYDVNYNSLNQWIHSATSVVEETAAGNVQTQGMATASTIQGYDNDDEAQCDCGIEPRPL